MPSQEVSAPTLEADPSELYATICAHPEYKRRPQTFPGDCEFVTTEFVHRDCLICCVVIHQLKKAFLVSLSAGEGVDLFEKLTGRPASEIFAKTAPAEVGR